ncbi:MAG: aminopeptidase N, partial [Arenicella sp.]
MKKQQMLENDQSPAIDDTTVYLKDYTEPDFAIAKITLDFQLGSNTTVVTADMQFAKTSAHQRALVLDGETFKLLLLKLDGAELQASDYVVSEKNLSIEQVPDTFELTVVTELQPHLNTQLSGLYQSSGNFCTQCEAEGFRRITYFLDRPDVLSEYEVSLTADKKTCPVLLSNGNPVACGSNSDGTHWHR